MELELETPKEKLPHKLRCCVQNYDWGISGGRSTAGILFCLNTRTKIDFHQPYAELWTGTHPSGPCFVEDDDELVSLKTWILENPNVLGKRVLEQFGTDLPFLFKVLSAAKALSIQAHPDKDLARNLHKLNPTVYKDANHKPEMALAITHFEALCGFVSLRELKDVLGSVPEIVELVGDVDADRVLQVKEQDGEEEVKSALKTIFTRLMSASKDIVLEMVSKMKNRLAMESEVRQLTEKEQLVLRLDKQYPDDIGVISAFFLNYVKLNPGEALCLGANEPHSYIYGECIECMATSDNVVRAGFTPKLRDVPTLCSMLTYKQGYPEVLQGTQLDQYTKRYSPPFDEFEVDCCILPQGASRFFPAIPGPSLFVVTAGEGIMETDSIVNVIDGVENVSEGTVLFVPAYTGIDVACTSDLQVYRAGVNSRFLEA